MSASRVTASSITQGLPKSRSLLAGNYAYGGGATWLIERINVASTTSSVTFSSIPQTFKHLQIRGSVQLASTADMNIQFNSDTGSNYAYHALYGSGASTATGLNTTSTSYGIYCGYFNSGSSSFAGLVVDILDYTSTNKYKTSRVLEGNDSNGSGYVFFNSGLWQSATAITSIKFYSKDGINLNQYSSFALYGVVG